MRGRDDFQEARRRRSARKTVSVHCARPTTTPARKTPMAPHAFWSLLTAASDCPAIPHCLKDWASEGQGRAWFLGGRGGETARGDERLARRPRARRPQNTLGASRNES